MSSEGQRSRLSSLLDEKQRSALVKMIDSAKCVLIESAVLRLFSFTKPPDHVDWKRKQKSVACLVWHELRACYQIKVFSLEGFFEFQKKKLVWEKDLNISELEYKEIKPLFHMIIDSENGMVGLTFKNKEEAYDFASAFQEKLSEDLSSQIPQQEEEFTANSDSTPSGSPKQNSKKNHPKDHSSALKKGSTSASHFSKKDIATPTDFAHIHHMSYSNEKRALTYNYMDKGAKYNIFKTKKDIFSGKNLEELLEAAGVTQSDLGDEQEQEDQDYQQTVQSNKSSDSRGSLQDELPSSFQPRESMKKKPSAGTFEFDQIMSELKNYQRESYYIKPDQTEATPTIVTNPTLENLEEEEDAAMVPEPRQTELEHSKTAEEAPRAPEGSPGRPNSVRKTMFAQIGADALKMFNERKERSMRVKKSDSEESVDSSSTVPEPVTSRPAPPAPAPRPRKSKLFSSNENLLAEEPVMHQISEDPQENQNPKEERKEKEEFRESLI